MENGASIANLFSKHLARGNEACAVSGELQGNCCTCATCGSYQFKKKKNKNKKQQQQQNCVWALRLRVGSWQAATQNINLETLLEIKNNKALNRK